MKLLLLGGDGQLGQRLQQALAELSVAAEEQQFHAA